MTWTTTNPVSIGAATKKSHYDALWDNCDMIKTDHNTDGTHKKLTVGSDADGDMYYRASSALARLAKGAANYKLFMNAGATAPEWASGISTISATRDLTADSGDVAYTGVGFKPSAIIAIAVINATSCMSIGFSVGLAEHCLYDYFPAYTDGYGNGQDTLIYAYPTTGDSQYAIVKTLDADGFTLTWTKTNTPEGTLALRFLCFR